MSERVIITRDGDGPRILRLEVVADIWREQDGASWQVVAGLMNGAPRVLASHLDEGAAAALWEAFREWIGHRGGLQFDVGEWQREQAELAAAGKRNVHRSTR